MADRVDRWLHAGDFTRTSLARYRVVHAALLLLLLPNFSWVAKFPQSAYNPPPGPFRLLPGFPPGWVLVGLEMGVAACLVAILLGWFTRTASFLIVPISVLGYGFTYSMAKIDHDILLVLVPPAMALAGWGDRMSLDAWRRGRRGLAPLPERAEQWPLRFYALMVGLGFFTAGLPKLLGGWLNPAIHTVQGIQVREYTGHGKVDLLAGPVSRITSPVFWEILDVATIVLELGMVVAVLTWATTRVFFALAATFHFGVYLAMVIPFFGNVIAYAWVLPWDRLPLPSVARERSDRFVPRLVTAAPLVVVGGGVAWGALINSVGDARVVMYPLILGLGGLVGGAFLALLATRALGALRDPGPAAAGRLVYDADCGFCTRSARWLAGGRRNRVEIVPWQSSGELDTWGLTEDDVTARAYWVGSGGDVLPGSQAIGAAMVARGGLALPVGRVITSSFVRPLSGVVYGWVASNRYQMPGGTDTCRVPAGQKDGEPVA